LVTVFLAYLRKWWFSANFVCLHLRN